MKLKNYLLLAGAALMMASCSQEDVFNPGLAEGEANVSFTINLADQLQTRSFGDGTTANKLHYAVYLKTGDNSYEKVNVDGYYTNSTNPPVDFLLSTTVNFQLLNGNTYKLVFVADKLGKTNTTGSHVVKFDANGASISNSSLGKSTITDEDGDIFWATEEFTVNGDLSGVIELKRAVAQINIGTNDYEVAEALGFNGITSATIGIQDYMNLNLFTGKVSGQYTGITSYTSKAYQKKDIEKYPVEGYKYVAVYYPLVGDEKELFDIQLTYLPTVKSSDKRIIASVPVQRNHRTNIYGSLLTSNYDLTVEIEPMFEEPSYTPDDFAMAVAFGGTVALPNDIEIAKQIGITKNTTIDLNGKTITSKIAPSGTQNQQVGLYVSENANLTLKGDAEGSTMTSAEGATSFLVGVNGGTVTVESGTYISDYKGPLFYIGEPDGGTVYIKGGTFKSGYTKEDSQSFLLNCEDAAYNKGTAKFVVTGGKFYNFNPEHSNAEPGLDHSWVAPGYKVISYAEGEDMVYTVVPENTVEISSTSDFATTINSINQSSDKEVTVFVAAGSFPTKSGNAAYTDWPSNKVINFIGQGKDKSIITQMDYYVANGSTINFKDLKLEVTENSTNHTALGLKGVKESSFENVDIYGEYHIFDGDATFKNCNFYFAGGGNNQTRYAIYEESDGKVLVEDCVFDTSCKTDDYRETKGILVYSTVHDNLGDLTVNNCKFIVSGANSTKAAIEIHSEKFLSAGTIKINNVTGDINKYNEGLWREINGGTPTKFFEVWVNGEKVQDREDPKN